MSAERGFRLMAARLQLESPSSVGANSPGIVMYSPPSHESHTPDSRLAAMTPPRTQEDLKAVLLNQQSDLYELASGVQRLLQERGAAEGLCSQCAALRVELDAALAAKADATTRLGSSEARVVAATARAANAEARAAVLEEELNDALLDAQARNTALGEAHCKLQECEAELEALEEVLECQASERKEVGLQMAAKDAMLAQLQATNASVQADAMAHNAQCRQELAHATAVYDAKHAQCTRLQDMVDATGANIAALQTRLDDVHAAHDALQAAHAAGEKTMTELQTELEVAKTEMAALREQKDALEQRLAASMEEAHQAIATSEACKHDADAAREEAASAWASAQAASSAKESDAQHARLAIERAAIERDIALAEKADALAAGQAAERSRSDAFQAVRQLRGEPDALGELNHSQLLSIMTAMEQGLVNLRRAALAAEVAARTAEAASAVECPVCMLAAKDTALSCGNVVCAPCAAQMGTCPVCRQKVTSRSRVFI